MARGGGTAPPGPPSDPPMVSLSHLPCKTSKCLRLMLATNPNSVISCEPLPGLSDQDVVLVPIEIPKCVIKQHPRTVYLYKLVDWET